MFLANGYFMHVPIPLKPSQWASFAQLTGNNLHSEIMAGKCEIVILMVLTICVSRFKSQESELNSALHYLIGHELKHHDCSLQFVLGTNASLVNFDYINLHDTPTMLNIWPQQVVTTKSRSHCFLVIVELEDMSQHKSFFLEVKLKA